jgi:hypothetical protein
MHLYSALFVLVVALYYGFHYTGLTGLLFTAGIAAIVYSFTDCIVTTAVVAMIFAVAYPIIMKKFMSEPFVTAADVTRQIEAIQKPAPKAKEPFGLYPASLEGFEDLQPEEEKEGAASSSMAAPAKTTPAVSSEHVEKVTKAVKDVAKEEFESATGSLFKQGQMPSEHADGPKLDAGATIKKAMESFDANAVTNMTEDTKDLLKTQKKLMDMLVQMRPVLADGKQLMETFSGMFGAGGKGFL